MPLFVGCRLPTRRTTTILVDTSQGILGRHLYASKVVCLRGTQRRLTNTNCAKIPLSNFFTETLTHQELVKRAKDQGDANGVAKYSVRRKSTNAVNIFALTLLEQDKNWLLSVQQAKLVVCAPSRILHGGHRCNWTCRNSTRNTRTL